MTADEAIIHTLLPLAYASINALLEKAEGVDKKTVMTARRLLPAGYSQSLVG